MTKRLLSAAVFVFGMAAFGLAGTAEGDHMQMAAVQAANDGFYSALNAMFTGDTEAMKAVWSHAADITYMGPGGEFLVGWDAIGPEWERQASAMLGGHVDATDPRMTVGHDLAVISTVEVGLNENAEIGKQNVSIRATNIFRLEDGQWKMIGHHTDLLPWL
jgi:ketosteroid isomerase-like protein